LPRPFADEGGLVGGGCGGELRVSTAIKYTHICGTDSDTLAHTHTQTFGQTIR